VKGKEVILHKSAEIEKFIMEAQWIQNGNDEKNYRIYYEEKR
jgi:hypothetical protein